MQIPKTIHLYISPFFINRYYLKKDIKYFTKKYSFNGELLDVGCGEKPYQCFFQNSNYKGIDFKNYSKNRDFSEQQPNFFFKDDYKKNYILPFKNSTFRNVVAFQVLEHHSQPETMLKEIARIMQTDGYLLISFPFIGCLHEIPNDYQRWTEYKIIDVLESNGFKPIEVKKEGSFCSTLSTLCLEQLNNFASKNRKSYYLVCCFYPIFLFMQYLSLLLDKIFISSIIFTNYIVLAKKINLDNY